MENSLQVFSYEGNGVRTVRQGDETWWVLKDVCDVLGLSNPSIVADRLDEDERAKFDLGRQGETNIINESGLYNVILRSDKPEAKKFKRWVTHEVLPSIRKHGLYAVDELLNNPDLLIDVLQQLKAEREANKTLSDEKELLEIALNESIQFYPVAKYNKVFNKNWSMEQCQYIGKQLTAYCRSRSIEIRKCETNDERFGVVNSYPITAWEDFMDEEAADE